MERCLFCSHGPQQPLKLKKEEHDIYYLLVINNIIYYLKLLNSMSLLTSFKQSSLCRWGVLKK